MGILFGFVCVKPGHLDLWESLMVFMLQHRVGTETQGRAGVEGVLNPKTAGTQYG